MKQTNHSPVNANLLFCPTTLQAGWLAQVDDLIANYGGNADISNAIFRRFANCSEVPLITAWKVSGWLP